MQVDLDARIPPQLYVAVAELLAWLYRIEQGSDAGTRTVARDLPESLRPRPAADAQEGETALNVAASTRAVGGACNKRRPLWCGTALDHGRKR